jgi:hypothetical protein
MMWSAAVVAALLQVMVLVMVAMVGRRPTTVFTLGLAIVAIVLVVMLLLVVVGLIVAIVVGLWVVMVFVPTAASTLWSTPSTSSS